jgi:hypothetical protein
MPVLGPVIEVVSTHVRWHEYGFTPGVDDLLNSVGACFLIPAGNDDAGTFF